MAGFIQNSLECTITIDSLGQVRVFAKPSPRDWPQNPFRRETTRGLDGFEQLKERKEGLRLGLAISKAIVEMHGGSIRAQSEGVGKGATFTVTLPLAPK